MPRHAAVKYETIFDTLKNLQLFDENGKLKRQKDPVWVEACTLIPEMKMKNLFIFVHQDRKNIKTNLMKYLNIQCPEPAKSKKIKTKKEPKYNSNWDDYDYYETLDTDCSNQENIVNELENILSLKNNEEYKNVIHRIGMLPFSIIYCHPDQITLWNDIIKINSTVSLIVIDQLISNVIGINQTNTISMCALTVKVNNSIVALGQLMSDSMAYYEIQYFLNTWLQVSALAPAVLVVGYSYNLLNAATMAFNSVALDIYILRCFEYITNEVTDLPTTLVKVDIIGLINIIDSWKCFETILQPVKDLYLCTIMYLSTVDDLNVFNETVVNLLTLCLSPFQSDTTESRRKALWENLITNTIQEMNQEYIKYMTGKYSGKSFSFLHKPNSVIRCIPQNIYNYINQLKEQALAECDFTTNPEKVLNHYYCPSALEKLMGLLVEFPLWTNLIVKNDKCSSLSSFATIRHISLLHEWRKPMAPSKFMVYHLEKILLLIKRVRLFSHKGCSTKKICNDEQTSNDETASVKILLTNNQENEIINSIDECTENEVMNVMDEFAENEVISSMEDCTEIQVSQSNVNHEPNEEMNTCNELGFDLSVFKNSIYSTIHSLLDFDECLHNILRMQIPVGDEMGICKILLDCCAEMNKYEKFLGIVAERLCASNESFPNLFKEIFQNCYDALELFDKTELKNIIKLYAHLLISNSISWDTLSVIKLNQVDMSNVKINFVRFLLQQMSDQIGVSELQRRFQNKAQKSIFKGLFPTGNSEDALFAHNFYQSIGLQSLGDILKANLTTGEESTTLKRSSSNTSISSTNSCDFVIELRVSKKHGLEKSANGKKKVIVIN